MRVGPTMVKRNVPGRFDVAPKLTASRGMLKFCLACLRRNLPLLLFELAQALFQIQVPSADHVPTFAVCPGQTLPRPHRGGDAGVAVAVQLATSAAMLVLAPAPATTSNGEVCRRCPGRWCPLLCTGTSSWPHVLFLCFTQYAQTDIQSETHPAQYPYQRTNTGI